MRASTASLATAIAALSMACENGSGGGPAAGCATTYSGESSSCTVGAICGSTIYRANCDQAGLDGGAGQCVCEIIDAGAPRTVSFQSAICTPLGSNNDPTPNFNAANAACGWNL